MSKHKQNIFYYSTTKYPYFVHYKKNLPFFKAPAAGSAAPASQFLQEKKRKHVYATGLTSCWYRCPRATIFTRGKVKNRYVQLAWPVAGISAVALRFLHPEKRKHVRITGLTSCWLSCRFALQFLQPKKRKQVRTTILTSCWHNCPPALRFLRLKKQKQVCATNLTSCWHSCHWIPQLCSRDLHVTRLLPFTLSIPPGQPS